MDLNFKAKVIPEFMPIMRHPKLGEMLEACKDEAVVAVFDIDGEAVEHLVTLNPELANDDVMLIGAENIEESISVAYWTFSPRTRSHMCIDWRLQ